MPDVILSAPLPTDILVVRHAEVHNPKNILYGRLPRYGLSAHGRSQALQTAKFTASRPVAAIYTSPLLRARQTATILSQYHPGVPIRRSRALIEVGSSYQGSPNSILKKGFSFYHPVMDPDDETMAQVASRMLGCIRRIVRRHVGQVVVVLSHADPITILRLALEGRELTTENLHSAVYSGRSSVTQVNLNPGREIHLAYFNVGNDPDT
jgi:broad specificity phosphatase PhoE